MIKYIFLLLILCCSGCRHAQTEDTVIKVSVLRGPSVIAFADWLENPPIIDNKKVQVKVVGYQTMKKYVADNIAFTKEFVEKNLPGVNMVEHEGTYLIWLDFNGLGLCTQELEDLIVHKAKLWLDSGRIFGKCGRGFQRINVACPRSTLKEALERIAKVLPADTVKFAS